MAVEKACVGATVVADLRVVEDGLAKPVKIKGLVADVPPLDTELGFTRVIEVCIMEPRSLVVV